MVDIELQNRKIEAVVYENEDGDISGQGLQDLMKDTLGVIADNVNGNEEKAIANAKEIFSNSEAIADNAVEIVKANAKIDKNTEDILAKADRVELAETDRHVLANTEAIEGNTAKIAGQDVAIKENAEAIKGKADKSQVDQLEGKVEQNRIGIADNASKIGGKADKSEISRLEGEIYSNGQLIQENKEAIAKKADSADVAGMQGQIDSNRNEIGALKASVAKKQEKLTAGNGIVIDMNNIISASIARFDATQLYESIELRQPVSNEFYKDLQDAMARKDLLYIYDELDGGGFVQLILMYVANTNGEYVYSAFNGRESYIMKLNQSTKMVSLDTERIGAEFSIFNNREGINILNLQEGSTSLEIRDVFTDARGEERIPDTGDVFNVWENSNLAQSGLVLSSSEDTASLDLQVLMNDIVKAHAVVLHLSLEYKPQVGMESLKVLKREESILDWSLLSSSEQEGIRARLEKTEGEINEYNISKLNQSVYDLQGAISALNEYLGGGSRSFGMKVTFIDSSEMIPKTFKFVKGTFTSIFSWEEVVPYRVIDQLVCGMDRFGHAEGLSVDIEDMYRICGSDLILYGHGTPSALTIPKQKGVPSFIGQVYIDLDASNNGRYYSKGTHSVADWTK